MKKIINSMKNEISQKQLLDFFLKEAKLEKEKTENRNRGMKHQFNKVTGGKSVIVSNCK